MGQGPDHRPFRDARTGSGAPFRRRVTIAPNPYRPVFAAGGIRSRVIPPPVPLISAAHEINVMTRPSVERSFSHPNVQLQCHCGWEGLDADVEDWAIEEDHDRVVRKCPSCETVVPEWGALRPIDGAAKIARGPLAMALAEADYADLSE